MITRSVPSNETARLAAVEAVAWTSGAVDETLEDIVAMAAEIFAAPVAVISLTERDTQNAIAVHGGGRVAIPRESSISSLTVALGETLIVADAAQDARLLNNPFVVSAPHVRFYAGAPLRSADGHTLGTLCVLDTKPRDDVSADMRQRLERFARLAEQRLHARALQKRLACADEARHTAEANTQLILREAIGAFVACDRLSLSLEGNVRARFTRIERALDEGRAEALAEVAALRDVFEEMAAMARLDRKSGDRSLSEPSAIVRAIADDLAVYAVDRGASLHVQDNAPGIEMLVDYWRFEELIEAALSDCICATHGPIALRCGFESSGGEEEFVVRLSADNAETPWRLSARNRELIDAMGGNWELRSQARALALFLPARLRTASEASPPMAANVISFDRSRKGNR